MYRITNELSALDRIIYLLGEDSFQYLSVHDEDFATVIEKVFDTVEKGREKLLTNQ